jgi:hypothetical protein
MFHFEALSSLSILKFLFSLIALMYSSEYLKLYLIDLFETLISSPTGQNYSCYRKAMNLNLGLSKVKCQCNVN